MTWNHPSLLLGLWLLPLLAWLMYHAERRRLRAAETLLDPEMTRRLLPRLFGPRTWIRGLLLLLGLASCIVAAAGPRFGVYFETVTQRGVDVFVCLDVSRSMLAEDVRPNRLARAKNDIRDLLAELGGDRVGLIAFAGKPVVKVPLTDDRAYFRMLLEEVNTHSAPRGGTLLGDAIRKALEAMPEDKTRDQAIVLITDGEDQESFPLEAAESAAGRGVKIFTVGLGDPGEGARIPLRDERGQLYYLQGDDGEHWSRVDETLLREVAVATGGAYISAGVKAYDLGRVYREHLADLARGARTSERRRQYKEQFQVFLSFGVLLLLAWQSIPRYARRRVRQGVEL